MVERDSKEVQHLIVGLITSQGDLTVATMASHLGLRPHVVRYHLEQLIHGKKVKLARFVNYRVFGWQIINILFDLPRASKRRALDFLARRPEVFWLAQNLGPRDFESTFAVEEVATFSKLLHDLSDSTGVHFRDPIIAHEVEERHWGLRYLSKTCSHTPTSHFEYPTVIQKIDPVDRKIMRVVGTVSGASVRDIAQAVGLALTTANYRLDRLREWGAISPDTYVRRVDHEFVQSQVVLNVKARGKQCDREIVDLCSKEPYVEGLITGLGCWDYKIILRADTVQHLIQIEESVLSKLGRNVARTAMYVRNRIIQTRGEP